MFNHSKFLNNDDQSSTKKSGYPIKDSRELPLINDDFWIYRDIMRITSKKKQPPDKGWPLYKNL
jgi:hypothetical protein